MWTGWANVGLWVAVCFLAKIFYIGLHVNPRLHAWHSHWQSRSHFAFSSLSNQWEIRLFFHFSKLFFKKITVSFTMVIKRSPGGPCRWRAVNFEIHLWSSGMNADCIWRSICNQHVQIEAGLNSDPGNDSFWDKSVTLSMLIDLLTSTCRSTQVKIASTDLWPQGMFTFSEMLALVESESNFGAYVCHRRPGGSLATSDLVRCHAGSCKGAEQISIDVDLWVAVCFLAKISFHLPTCKTTFARLTQSQAISQSFRVFITSDQWEIRLFFIFRTH